MVCRNPYRVFSLARQPSIVVSPMTFNTYPLHEYVKTHKISYSQKRWTPSPASAWSPSFSVYVLLLCILFLIIFCLIPVHGIIGFLNGIHNFYDIGYPLTTSGNGQISKVGRFIPQPFQLTGKFAFGYMLEQYYKFISAKAVHMVHTIESHQKTSNGTKSCIPARCPSVSLITFSPFISIKITPTQLCACLNRNTSSL